MANDTSGFVQLCEKFATIDLLGEGPPTQPSDDDLEQAIAEGVCSSHRSTVTIMWSHF